MSGSSVRGATATMIKPFRSKAHALLDTFLDPMKPAADTCFTITFHDFVPANLGGTARFPSLESHIVS